VPLGMGLAKAKPANALACGTPINRKHHKPMKKTLLFGAALAVAALGTHDLSIGHGGTYLGPGDTVPPGGGGGGQGGPGTGGPSGPSKPGTGGPITPGGRGPGAPQAGRPVGPGTGGANGPDLTQWEFWWGFNKAPYLNLKSHIHAPAPGTGTDDYFLGQGQTDQAQDSTKPSESTIRAVIVPALLQALEKETDNDIVTGSLIALAKIGDEQGENGVSEFETVILPFLSSARQEISETAAIALGILSNPQSVATLRSLLLDDDDGRQLVGSEAGVNYRTRAFAAYGLGQIGDRASDPMLRQEIVQLLWDVCESPRQSTRDVKVAAVIAMGLVPLDIAPQDLATLKAVTGRAPQTRHEQVLYMLDFFMAENDQDKPALVRAHAPRAICKLMSEVSDKALKDTVVQGLAPYVLKRSLGDRELRQSAALAFGMLGDLDDDDSDVLIRERLQLSASAADQQLKNFSVMAMGQLGGRPGNGERATSGAPAVRKFLLQQLARGKTQVKPWAGLAIGVMERGLAENQQPQSADSLRALRLALQASKTKREVGAYAIACGIARDTDSESILLEKLDNMSEDAVRGHLAIGLGLMDSRESIEPIQALVSASKYRAELLQQAATSLGLLGDRKLVGQLVTMLENAKSLSTQAAIASALGFIGDSSSVDPLVQLLGDESVTAAARGFAAAALGIVADKEPLPWNAKFSVDINYRANTHTLTGGGGTGLLELL
jgi:HEAT repeat protein